MIDFTDQQLQAIAASGDCPITVVDPRTNTSYVVVRADVFHRLIDYDDSPWTDEEMDALAAEAGGLLDEYGTNHDDQTR